MIDEISHLKNRCNNLTCELINQEKNLKLKYEYDLYEIKYQDCKIIRSLERENKHLKKVIDRFKITVQKFIKWICKKFNFPSEDEMILDFEKETYTNFDIEKQLDTEQLKKDQNDFEIEL